MTNILAQAKTYILNSPRLSLDAYYCYNYTGGLITSHRELTQDKLKVYYLNCRDKKTKESRGFYECTWSSGETSDNLYPHNFKQEIKFTQAFPNDEGYTLYITTIIAGDMAKVKFEAKHDASGYLR